MFLHLGAADTLYFLAIIVGILKCMCKGRLTMRNLGTYSKTFTPVMFSLSRVCDSNIHRCFLKYVQELKVGP